MNFTLGLFLDLSLLIPTHSSPDLSIFFLSNQLFSASGPYHFPSAETYLYGFHAAPWSSNQNGVCPLVKHLVMLQESVHPLGVCLFDPFVDFTNLCVQPVPMVESMAEDVLRFGDGLRDRLSEFAPGDMFVGLSLFETGMGAFTEHWIWSDRLFGCSGHHDDAPIYYGQQRAATVVSSLLMRGTRDGLDSPGLSPLVVSVIVICSGLVTLVCFNVKWFYSPKK
ncbi:hypothetical protein ACLB2K_047323 [Fragaria x ananassa]